MRLFPTMFALSLMWVGAGCTHAEPTTRWSRHFDGAVWGGAVIAQTESAKKWAPAVGLAATSALAVLTDRETQRENSEAPVTEGNESKGNVQATSLALLSGGVAIGEWIGGDGGHSFEVMFESFLVVDGITEILKRSFPRDRPDRTNNDSFPSGHTSFAFTMATYLGRRIDDLGDDWYYKLGYLGYLPAAYVGISRTEADRHWPSDVAVGALLGLVLTNIVYDAHFGTPGHAGIHQPHARRWSVEPSLDEEGVGMGLVLRFE